MVLKCLGSGSSGNCWLLTAPTGSKLVIDMGFPFSKIKQFVDFDILNTVFLVSHIGHSDHGKGAMEAVKLGCTVFYQFPKHEAIVTGEWMFTTFDVVHDVPTVGFLIYHESMGTLCFITDTSYIPHLFENVNHWIIEANFCEDQLSDSVFHGHANQFLGERIFRSHLSVQDCERVLLNQDLSKTETIIIHHLSSNNSNEKQFVDRIKKSTGKPTYAAKPGLTLNLELWN